MLNKDGVQLSCNTSNNSLNINYNNRAIDVQLTNCMDNTQVTTETGDTGLLTQTQGAATGQLGTQGQYMVEDSPSNTAAPVLIFQDDSASSLANTFLNSVTTNSGYEVILQKHLMGHLQMNLL